MCFNAKVGTTSWSQYLLNRARPGLLEKLKNWHMGARQILKPPHKRDSPETLAMMEDFGKVMIVRHPFARIVSAYLDKIAGTQYLRLQRRIIAQYRSPIPSSSATSSRHPTFEEFVRYLVSVMPPVDDVTAKYRQGPSNVHWSPFHVNCAPCDIDYDVILNMETINEDTRYVSERFGLGLQEGVWNNRAATNSSEVTALSFFKAIPRNLTLALHQRYRIDFLMFGYSEAPFLAET